MSKNPFSSTKDSVVEGNDDDVRDDAPPTSLMPEDPFERFAAAPQQQQHVQLKHFPTIEPTTTSSGGRRRSSALQRKASMLMPGSFSGNDFDDAEQLLDAPEHRGATSATGFLRFLSEEGMDLLRKGWGNRAVTVDQFLDVLEPILQSSANGFFDEEGKRRTDIWASEGWISSAQRAATLYEDEQRRKREQQQQQHEQQQQRRKDSVDDGDNDRDIAKRRGRMGSLEGEVSDAPPVRRLSRIASTISIQQFLEYGNNNAPTTPLQKMPSSSTLPPRKRRSLSTVLPFTIEGDGVGGEQQLALDASLSLNGGTTLTFTDTFPFTSTIGSSQPPQSKLPSSPGGAAGVGSRQQQRRRLSSFRLTDNSRSNATGQHGGESELRQYLRNLYAYVDYKRQHKMTWDHFSSFLVDGITGAAFRGGGEKSTQAAGAAASAAATTMAESDSPRGRGVDDGVDSGDGSGDGSDDADGQDSDTDQVFHNYRISAEVPLPSAVTDVSQPTAQQQTMVPMQRQRGREWVVSMAYHEDVDKVLVVMKHAICFLDPAALPGGGGAVAAGDAAADVHQLHHSGASKVAAAAALHGDDSGSGSSVIGNPTASCLPLHVIPSIGRNTAGLFLPAPFWATVAFDTERGISSASIWQYQVAPARPPEMLLKAKVFPTCNDSCMLTCCLYTKPVTDAERLGLDTARTMLECALWLGTRDGRILVMTVVKNTTNASKPTYAIKSLVEVGRHKDVVACMLHMPHVSSVCVASLDGDVRIYEVKKHVFRCRAVLRYHKLGVTSLAYARDTLTLFTSGHDGIVAAWSENMWSSPSYLLQDLNHSPTGPVLAIRCIPQSNVVTTFDSGGTLRFFDTRDRRVVYDISAVDPQVIAAGIVRREDLRKDVEEGAVHATAVVGTSSSSGSHKRSAGIGLFSSMVFTGSIHRQFLIAGSHLYLAVTADVHKRNPLCTYDQHRPILFAAMSSVFGLVTTSNAEVTLWSLKNGMPDTRHRHVCDAPITAVTCRPSSDVMLLGQDSGAITAIQVSTGTVLQQYNCHDQTIAAFSLHPTKPILASACRGVDGLLCLWTDERLLGIGALPRVQNSQTQVVHPTQVLPLPTSPVVFLEFDPTGAVIAVGFPQRILFFAQHVKFSRWVEVRSISHGRVTEMNAFAWLDLRHREHSHGGGGGGCASYDALENSGRNDSIDRCQLMVGDARGYLLVWQVTVDRSDDSIDVVTGTSHTLLHLGNNVSTSDRFFAAKRQKMKALLRQQHRGGTTAATAVAASGASFSLMSGSFASSGEAHGGGGLAPAHTTKATASLSTTSYGDTDTSLLQGDDGAAGDPELKALLEQQQQVREAQLSGKDPASIVLRKKMRARQYMDVLMKEILRHTREGGGGPPGARVSVRSEVDRELEVIRVEAALREKRRGEEEELLMVCRDGRDSSRSPVTADPAATTTADGGGSASATAPPAPRKLSRQEHQAEKKRLDRRRRLTKAGLFSMAQLQQTELASASPTLSTMDRQLALAMEKQQHERTQSIKHYHPGASAHMAISGEELLAPPITCVAADAIYPFLMYTGDEAGRLIVWYVGSADPFLAHNEAGANEAVASWLKEPRPISTTTPHGEASSVLGLRTFDRPFHSVLSWGSDNCVVLSTWSGLVLGRFQQGPIPDRRWALGPLLAAFNTKSFTVQIMWMKLKRFVLEGYFSKVEAAPPRCRSTTGDSDSREESNCFYGMLPFASESSDVFGGTAARHRNARGTGSLGDHLWGAEARSPFRSMDEGAVMGGSGVAESGGADNTPPPLPPLRCSIRGDAAAGGTTDASGGTTAAGSRRATTATTSTTTAGTFGIALFGGDTQQQPSAGRRGGGGSKSPVPIFLDPPPLPSPAAGTTEDKAGDGEGFPMHAGAGRRTRQHHPPSSATAKNNNDEGDRHPIRVGAMPTTNMMRHLNKQMKVRLPSTPAGAVRHRSHNEHEPQRLHSPPPPPPKTVEELRRQCKDASQLELSLEAAADVAFDKILQRSDVRGQLSPQRSYVAQLAPRSPTSASDEVEPSPAPCMSEEDGDGGVRGGGDAGLGDPDDRGMNDDGGTRTMNVTAPSTSGDAGPTVAIASAAGAEVMSIRSGWRLPAASPLVATLQQRPLVQTTTPTVDGGGSKKQRQPVITGRVLTERLLPSWLQCDGVVDHQRQPPGHPSPTASQNIAGGLEEIASHQVVEEGEDGAPGQGGGLPGAPSHDKCPTAPSHDTPSWLSGPEPSSTVGAPPPHHHTPHASVASRSSASSVAEAARRMQRLNGAISPLHSGAVATTHNIISRRSGEENHTVRARAASSLDVVGATTQKQRSGARSESCREEDEDEEDDPVERAIHASREKKRQILMASRVEVNRRRHETIHSTQAIMRQTLYEIDKVRTAAALGRTPYYQKPGPEEDVHSTAGTTTAAAATNTTTAGRIVFTRKAIISKVPATTRSGPADP